MSNSSSTRPMYLHSAIELATLIKTGVTTSRAVTELFLERIHTHTHLNAFTLVCAERALALADNADRLQQAGIRLSPLHGVPVALKEHFQWAGTIAHYGSKARADMVSDHNSALVNQLMGLGMVILGKTSMTEFAFGLSGQNPSFGTAKNPWHATEHRAPGGSSSGAGVAVSMGLAPLVLGGDTGGSVRAPAALNHTVGYKPTSGLLSRSHCMPLCETLDVLGPISHTVADARLITQLLATPELEDEATLATAAMRTQKALRQNAIAPSQSHLYYLSEAAWPATLQPAAYANWLDTLALLRQNGWTLTPWTPQDLAFFTNLGNHNSTILAYEAYQAQGHYAEDLQAPMWAVVRARIMNGKAITQTAHQDALNIRQQVMATFNQTFPQGAVLLMPAIDQGAQVLDAEDTNHIGLGQLLRPANFLGIPAINLPTGLDQDGMPLALQLLAHQHQDVLLLAMAEALEPSLPDTRLAPPSA
ncbi:MAG: amidase [Neisseriaceae bacterium]|nr:amidase [Neisseriaceae bacterium]MBP6862935.1 amidase [Neisseriaceae bacterium]